MSVLSRQVGRVARWLEEIYGLELGLRAEDYLIDPTVARDLLPAPSPSSGVVVVEEEGHAWVGLYVDPGDLSDPGTLVEETSHLICIAWHAAQDRPVSRLILELQAEIDCYVVARLTGRDPFHHLEHFAWADWMSAAARLRYELAHRVGRRYCRALARRFPRRADTPALLSELRRFYRAPAEAKLHKAAA